MRRSSGRPRPGVCEGLPHRPPVPGGWSGGLPSVPSRPSLRDEPLIIHPPSILDNRRAARGMQLHLDGRPELARPGARPESEACEFSLSTGRWPVLWSPCPLAGRKSVPARRNAKRSAICSPEAPSLCLQVPSASQGDPRPRLTPQPRRSRATRPASPASPLPAQGGSARRCNRPAYESAAPSSPAPAQLDRARADAARP